MEANVFGHENLNNINMPSNCNVTIRPRIRSADDHDTVVVYNTDTNSGGDLMP